MHPGERLYSEHVELESLQTNVLKTAAVFCASQPSAHLYSPGEGNRSDRSGYPLELQSLMDACNMMPQSIKKNIGAPRWEAAPGGGGRCQVPGPRILPPVHDPRTSAQYANGGNIPQSEFTL